MSAVRRFDKKPAKRLPKAADRRRNAARPRECLTEASLLDHGDIAQLLNALDRHVKLVHP